MAIDQEAEVKRPELKRQVQEWAHLAQNPNVGPSVFVDQWSNQKGVDLIADIMPTSEGFIFVPNRLEKSC